MQPDPRTAIAATARTNISLRILLPRLHLRSHQTDFVNPGTVCDVDRLGHPLKIYGRVALDEDDALGAGLEDFLETSAQLCLIGGFTVDGHIVIGVTSDDHRALIRLVRL